MRARYVTARHLAQLQASLSDRDHVVLATLARVRVATTGQLERTCFEGVSRRRARQVLASLAGRQLLARLPRVVGGIRAGSSGYVWTLGVAGQRLMRSRDTRPQRPWTIGRAFLAHSLEVTELYVQLIGAERAGRLRLLDFTTEPACWRSFHGPGGGRAVLKPDAQIRLGLGRYEDRWFIELDRGTESQSTVSRKCDVYRRYWQSGTEQARSGVFPKVLWLVPDEPRHTTLVDLLGRQPAEAWSLFAVTLTAEAVVRLVQGAGA